MSPLYKMLEDKNYWYRKYLACSEAFLVGLRHAPEVALEELELFYGNRESLLKIIEGLDFKIDEFLQTSPVTNPSTEEQTKVQYYVREKDSIIERVLLLDHEIITGIEALQALGAEKMKLLAKGKKALAKYKSSFNYNDKIDKRV